jgi:hypothetical protein
VTCDLWHDYFFHAWIKSRAKKYRFKKKKKGENAKKFLVEKKKEKIGLDLMILLDKIKIGPGRDFTQKK